MRKIEYRGIDKNSNTWVYGFYYEEASPLVCIGDKEEDKGYIVFANPYECSDWGMPRQMLRAEIKKDTLGEFTGIKDKTKNKIYENDIVRLIGCITGDNRVITGKVVMEEGAWWIYSEKQAERLWDETAEVIKLGNIYENPEILKRCK